MEGWKKHARAAVSLGFIEMSLTGGAGVHRIGVTVSLFRCSLSNSLLTSASFL